MGRELYLVAKSLCLASAAIASVMAQRHCPLDSAKDGQAITFRAVVMRTAHDTLLKPLGCQDRVVLDYPDQESNGLPASTLRRDRNLSRFERVLLAHEKGTRTELCKECWTYEVVANFRGRLDIAQRAGLVFDEKSQKATGIEGFGHPMPFTRFRLVLQSVANVQATRVKPR